MPARPIPITEEDITGESTNGPVDPKPNVVEVSSDRIQELVRDIDVATRKDWSETKDEMEDMMREHAAEGQAIAEAVVVYTERSEALIRHSLVVRESVINARKEFGKKRLPPSVTQLRRG